MDFLITQHSPVLYFHSNEKYFTSAVDFYLENSDVRLNNEVVLSSPSQQELYDFSKRIANADKANIHPRGEHIKVGNLRNTSIYAITKHTDNAIYITYLFFFPYNGAYNVLGCIKAGSHHADIEHFTIEIDPHSLTPLRYYFSNHGYEEGGWYLPEEIEFENNKPVIYVAKYSHGLFYKPGTVLRIGGFANDVMDKGPKLQPHNYNLIIMEKENSLYFNDAQSWIYYPGNWAPDGIRGVVGQAWYNRIESNRSRPKYFSKKICAMITGTLCASLIYAGILIWT